MQVFKIDSLVFKSMQDPSQRGGCSFGFPPIALGNGRIMAPVRFRSMPSTSLNLNSTATSALIPGSRDSHESAGERGGRSGSSGIIHRSDHKYLGLSLIVWRTIQRSGSGVGCPLQLSDGMILTGASKL